MKVFTSDPVEIPAVQLNAMEDDEQGRELLDRLEALQQRKSETEAEMREAGRPLSDLVAHADELAAQALVGDADREAADEAEAKVWELKQEIEQARRRIRQIDRASEIVREKLKARADTLHAENADAVRSVHRILLRQALDAQRRAATLARLLRDFEGRYARYESSAQTPSHPQYLGEDERARPPRPLLGPARTRGGAVFNASEASVWMQRAADLLDEEPPAIVDLTAIDYQDPDTAFVTYDLDAVNGPEASAPGEPPPASMRLAETDAATLHAGNNKTPSPEAAHSEDTTNPSSEGSSNEAVSDDAVSDDEDAPTRGTA